MPGNDFMKKRFQVGGYEPSRESKCSKCGKDIRGVVYKVKGQKMHQTCYNGGHA